MPLTHRTTQPPSPTPKPPPQPEEEKVHERQSTTTAWNTLRALGGVVAQLFPTYTPIPAQDPSQVEVKLLTEEDLAQNQEIQTLAEELGEPIADVADGLQQDLDSEEFTKAVNTIVSAFHEQRLDDIFTDNEKRKKYAKLVANLLEKNTRQSALMLHKCAKLYRGPHHYMFLKETTPKYQKPVLTNKFVTRLKKELKEATERTPKLSDTVEKEMSNLLTLRMGERIHGRNIQDLYRRLIKESYKTN